MGKKQRKGPEPSGGTCLRTEGKEKQASVDVKISAWAAGSVAQDLTEIENSRTGAGLQKDHELGLGVWT